MTFGMEPYLALILLGFLPSEVWRWVGLASAAASTRIPKSSCG